MNLIELIEAYRDIFNKDGKEAADSFLGDAGVEEAVQRHIHACFPEDRSGMELTLNDCQMPMSEVRLYVPFESDSGGGGDSLLVVMTHEGIIMDAFTEGQPDSISRGMTYLEWHESMQPKPVNQTIARLQEKYAGEDGGELDEDIIEQYSETASAVNNCGISDQIEVLVQNMGEEAAEARLREVYGR